MSMSMSVTMTMTIYACFYAALYSTGSNSTGSTVLYCTTGVRLKKVTSQKQRD